MCVSARVVEWVFKKRMGRGVLYFCSFLIYIVILFLTFYVQHFNWLTSNG